jgi:eukaryotic-like serine/threonine-protein kinase
MFWNQEQLIHNGKYRIERYLGGGGFAITYLATHTNLNHPVVIKTPNLSVQNDLEYPKYVERFKKEGRMLAQICVNSHPHIVQVIDLFEDDNRHCLVMQYIPGMSLWDLVRQQGKLSETAAVKYIYQIGLALVEVHRRNLLHLDVTPLNIMINSDSGTDKAVLIDFGIAADISPPSTFSRDFGNKTFAPYELIRKGIRHPTVDVYCLAASLYYAVTGEMPTNSLARKWEEEDLISPQQLVPSLSQPCCDAIMRGMALEAKERSQTMQEWLDLLTECYLIYLSHQEFTPKKAIKTSNLSVKEYGNISLYKLQQEPILCREISIKLDMKTEDPEEIIQKLIELYESEDEQLILPLDVATFSLEVGVDYTTLSDFLKAQNWREADKETTKLMLEVANREKEGWLDVESINNFPCADLRTIDQLWVKYSDGHFGFSVQKRIWIDCGGKVDYETQKALSDALGWRKDGSWLNYNNMKFTLNAPPGHLPLGGLVGVVGLFEVGLFSRVQTCKM